MNSLNKVFLIGNLTRDPEIRHTPKGIAVGDLGMAINMLSRGPDGAEKEEVCYVDVVLWGRQAEACKEYLGKGAPVFVEGRLQFDQWESQQGEKRSRLRVRAERVHFLGRGGGNSGGNSRDDAAERGSSGRKAESKTGESRVRESHVSPLSNATDDEMPL
ncbi:MAG: single-stranded DNA-binding protein [Methylacidiphilales bacterium]|nr:single-stranded DNA-binding protein [Candidatus Methylacidiphilales bacterium]